MKERNQKVVRKECKERVECLRSALMHKYQAIPKRVGMRTRTRTVMADSLSENLIFFDNTRLQDINLDPTKISWVMLMKWSLSDHIPLSE